MLLPFVDSCSLRPLSAAFRSKYSFSLSRLSPRHQSRQRSLSNCLEVLNSSTYHASFFQPLHQQVCANVIWFCYTTPFWAIFHAFRSWHVSKSHSSFSLLRQPPFWWRNKRTKQKRNTSPLSEKIPRLQAVPMNITRQNLHRRHHQQGQEFTSTSHLPFFHFLVHVPASILESCTKPQPRLSTCTTSVCAHLQRA